MKYNDNNNWYVKSETGAEPVTLAEVKAQLNMSFDTPGSYDFTDDDTFITNLIPVCREACEGYAGIAIKEKVIVAELRNECGNVIIPFPPVKSIDSSVDKDGTAVTLTTLGTAFPYITSPLSQYLKVEYTAGYATLATSYAALPKAIKQAIIEECAWRYINRGEKSGVGVASDQARNLLAPYNKKSWLQ